MGRLEVHRSGSGFLLGWFFLAVSLLTAGSAVWSSGYNADRRWAAGGIAIAIAAGSYLFGLRPAVEEESALLRVKNPLRNFEVPWAALSDARVTDVLLLDTSKGQIRCFAVPRRRGSRPKGSSLFGFGQSLVMPVEHRPVLTVQSGSQAVAARLLELAAEYRRANEPAEVRSELSVAAVASSVFLVLGVVIAVALW